MEREPIFIIRRTFSNRMEYSRLRTVGNLTDRIEPVKRKSKSVELSTTTSMYKTYYNVLENMSTNVILHKIFCKYYTFKIKYKSDRNIQNILVNEIDEQCDCQILK